MHTHETAHPTLTAHAAHAVVVAAPRTARVPVYVVISLVGAVANVVLLATTLSATGWPPVACNLAVATMVAVPTFVACRRWVWPGHQAGSRQFLRFWLSSIVNVCASSLVLVGLQTVGAGRQVLAVVPTLVYTVLWFVRLRYLDRRVFVD